MPSNGGKMPAPRRTMSPKADDRNRRRAVELYQGGATQAEIARALSVSTGWVQKVISQSGVTVRAQHRLPAVDAARWPVVLAMRLDGATCEAISREVGVSLSAVYAALRARAPNLIRGHAGKQRARISQPHLDAIIGSLRSGEIYSAIARRHGVTKQAISAIAIKNGLGRNTPREK